MNKYFLSLMVVFFALILIACNPSPEIEPLIPESAGVDTFEETAGTSTPVVAILPTATEAGRARTEKDEFVFEQSQRLAKGITVLPLAAPEESPDEELEGEPVDFDPRLYPISIDEKHILAIKEAGFDSVLLPVSWSFFAQEQSPYELDVLFLDDITQLVDGFLAADLAVALYFDDYPELNEEPRLHTERFLDIWEQLSDHFKDYPEELLFGIYLNPQGTFATTSWNDTANDTIKLIRKSNPDRTLMLGADFFNPNFLPGFNLPEEDRNLIVTFSFFQPFRFTVQGINQYLEQFIGTTWDGTEEEKDELNRTMDSVAEYSRKNARPVVMSSFGVTQVADSASRGRWLNAVTRAAEEREISWFILGFGNASPDMFPFGIYDFETETWDNNTLLAIFPEE